MLQAYHYGLGGSYYTSQLKTYDLFGHKVLIAATFTDTQGIKNCPSLLTVGRKKCLVVFFFFKENCLKVVQAVLVGRLGQNTPEQAAQIFRTECSGAVGFRSLSALDSSNNFYLQEVTLKTLDRIQKTLFSGDFKYSSMPFKIMALACVKCNKR